MPKKTYYVCLSAADDSLIGEVELDEKEYEVVKYATDPANWKNVNDCGPYRGYFEISDKPITIC